MRTISGTSSIRLFTQDAWNLSSAVALRRHHLERTDPRTAVCLRDLALAGPLDCRTRRAIKAAQSMSHRLGQYIWRRVASSPCRSMR
jgi:hypothetical protein